jgi:glyoxylase-like metal-dependent hydrolase (beta-lactamase superfamily II)
MGMSLLHKLTALGIHVLERGWLSSNCTLLLGATDAALVDSGFHTHSPQTLTWLYGQLKDRSLEVLLNTHLHSDHCGGNVAIQAAFPALRTAIPATSASAVSSWQAERLSFVSTGQDCPRFVASDYLLDGQSLSLGGLRWHVWQAKGHDPDSVVLFQEDHRILISADALWEDGFGVVFPELSHGAAFDDVEHTLNMIEDLNPDMVIPGHGPVFRDVGAALLRARSRLDHFRRHPDKHTRHAIKVLIKFKLLEWQRVSTADLLLWCRKTPLVSAHMPSDVQSSEAWLQELLTQLAHFSALRIDGPWVFNR